MDSHRIKKNLMRRVADTKAVLSRHFAEARQMLQKLVERFEFKPVEINGRRGYRFAGVGSYAGLLDGAVFSPTVVAPTGFARIRPTRFPRRVEGRLARREAHCAHVVARRRPSQG